LSYLDVLRDKAPVGDKVAIIGAGGIGFDVAEYLTHEGSAASQDIPTFMREWGVDMTLAARGGVEGVEARPEPSRRSVSLLQRKQSKVGAGLGKTTGWIHRAGLEKRAVAMVPGCEYRKIDDEGLHLSVDGEPRLFEVDNIIVCAGQTPRRELAESIKSKKVHLIGGADVAAELDAKRAIDQGTRLAAKI
jgi:2,4-dienoyl-CoA reductase (NADPH2)